MASGVKYGIKESILGNYTWKSSVKNNLNIHSPESLDDSPAADKDP